MSPSRPKRPFCPYSSRLSMVSFDVEDQRQEKPSVETAELADSRYLVDISFCLFRRSRLSIGSCCLSTVPRRLSTPAGMGIRFSNGAQLWRRSDLLTRRSESWRSDWTSQTGDNRQPSHSPTLAVGTLGKSSFGNRSSYGWLVGAQPEEPLKAGDAQRSGKRRRIQG